jgi:hypothetical protein
MASARDQASVTVTHPAEENTPGAAQCQASGCDRRFDP